MDNSSLEISRYDSTSPLNNVRQFFADITRSTKRAWHPAWALVTSNLLSKYRQSALGILWVFIPPFLLAATAVMARRANVLSPLPTQIPYTLFVMVGTSLWQTFCEAVMGPMQLVTRLRPMLTKINFPREAIALATVVETCAAFIPKLLLIALLCVWFDIFSVTSLLLGTLAVLPLILLGTMVGIFLAPLSLIYEDTARIVSLLLGVWLFITPVLYPRPASGVFATLISLNPVTPLLTTAQELFTASALTALGSYCFISVLVMLALLGTWITFRVALPFAVERLSA